MIYNIEFETLPREALEAIQLRRLQATVQRVYATVPFYRKKFEEAGISPADIKTLKDLQRLPFTTKQDLRDNYPFGMFAVPMDNVVRIHASSGTTGKPTVVGYTARDIATWVGTDGPGPGRRGRLAAATSFTMPTAMGSSPAGWGSTTGQNVWGLRLSRSRAETPSVRSSS